ncbi:hypothetical protein BAQ_A0099 (plasmid) [Bacillus anthracis str. A0193]|nr:hypothetical protein BAA_A0022 [Bacillus anthracis str. A0248]AFH86887.1 Hypothetical Protein H9401_5502 [Bacillus anthracis str. H9401]AHK41645.1 hypothetical protein BAPAT_pXO10021 [Bacillus anthracis str. SVA11]EDR85365.1 hypothetical protein BAQ_A0099 [Bacillus anthracis str. A0193]
MKKLLFYISVAYYLVKVRKMGKMLPVLQKEYATRENK